MGKVVWIAIALSVAAAELAVGQTIRRGRGDPKIDPKLDAALAANPRVFTRDTFFTRGDTVRGPILSLGNRLIIEGTILGDLTVIDANVYIRPSARIEGNVLNIGSGLYRSELATITGRI